MEIDNRVDAMGGTLAISSLPALHGFTYKVDYAVEALEAALLQDTWVHVILKVAVVDLEVSGES